MKEFTLLPVTIVFIPLILGLLIFIISEERLKAIIALGAGLFGLISVAFSFKLVTEGNILASQFFAISSFGLIGVPFTLGFLSKWYLWMGPIETQQPLFMAVLIISNLLCAFYLLPIVSGAFFRHAEEDTKTDKSSWLYLLPIGLTSLGGLKNEFC
ncbi:MAG: hypothetical protein Q8M92_07945 [Candidatus Subteraquimicrobiales bacterium]|nr:hypothetical protein [Candidatus Subteraquimicrobiales bacterium]